ncbi:MAG: HNH endonuclease [Ferruginibacter sp.]|nr:HNH endonuclease [Ferruginibacter sp.]
MMKKLCLLLSLIALSICCFSQNRYISQTTKKIVYTRDGGICRCCGSSANLEYDHIMPFSCGGSSEVSNIQLLCRSCNRSKSNSCFCKIHDKEVGVNCCDGRSIRSGSKVLVTTSSSSQCTGITQKGIRCKKRTTNSNGRCHLHQF